MQLNLSEQTSGSILFDLDGTLLDTAPDLVAALNAVLAEEGKAARSLRDASAYVSRGARGLILCGFGEALSEQKYDQLSQSLIRHYRLALFDKTTLFDGMSELLDVLDAQQTVWGVVTNKASDLTEPILKGLNLFDRAHVLVCGDTTAQRKPAPEPLLYACKMAGITPQNTLYIGDDPRDVQAANAAGMVSVAVRYGYYDASENPDLWGADFVIDHPRELSALLTQ